MLIEILGTSFQIKSDENPEYLNKLVEYYTQKVNELKNSSKTFDPVKIAILGGIVITDELFKAKNENNSGPVLTGPIEEFDKIIMQMIDKIDKTLYDS